MLKEITGETIGFLDYTIAVLPAVAVLLPVGFFILTRAFKIDIESVDKAHELLKRKSTRWGR